MIVLEILAGLLGWLLPLSWGREHGRLDRSPRERRQARLGRWFGGLFLALLAGVYCWASHRL